MVKIMKIKFILIYYTRSRYFGMRREHILIFRSIEDLVSFREKHEIEDYEMYKQIV